MKLYTGKKFGYLTAISLNEVVKIKTAKYVARKYFWNYVCDCGTKVIRERQSVRVSLKKKYNISCGCKSGLPEQEASFNAFYRGYEYGAKKRKLEFSLSKEEFKEISLKNCYYCNSYPNKERKATPYLNGYFVGNGIDRLINNIGYSKDNSVPCCTVCNFAKGTMNFDDFKSWINKVSIQLNK